MTYLYEIILLAINIAMAAYHSKLIKDGKRIRHGLWGGLYFILAGGFSLLSANFFLFIAACFLRKVFFDISLNLFRGLPIFYVSNSPKSIIDKLHYKLFGVNSEIYMTLYFIKIIFLNIFFL